jgi:hypothetical protein
LVNSKEISWRRKFSDEVLDALEPAEIDRLFGGTVTDDAGADRFDQ